jgi:hypothetical protein
MTPHRRLRLPVSTRHAFALAFDLAFRRDLLHSLLMPALLRAPWLVAIALLPAPRIGEPPGRALALSAAALIGDFLTVVLVEAMMRFRARSVFNTPLEVRPGPVTEHYALGLARLPWLVVTEIVRNLAILFAGFFFILPGVFLGFRLSFATEAVVLHQRDTESAFRRSFHLTPGRFERWFEMIVASVGLVLGLFLFTTLMWVFVQGVAFADWTRFAYFFVTVGLLPVIQYAWTFFYLRLVEVDVPPGVEVGPLYAGPAPAVAPDAAPAATAAGPAAPAVPEFAAPPAPPVA